MKTILLTIVAVTTLTVLTPILQAPADASSTPNQADSNRTKVAEIYRRALRRPFDEAAVKEYMDALPKVGDYFVIEGDILVTEQELHADLVSKSLAPKVIDPTTELTVKLNNGEHEFYKNPTQRTLTYAVARSTFSSDAAYQTAVNNTREAAKAWEDACPSCGIRFKYMPQHDAAPSNSVVNFTVRQYDSARQYLAAAFFPYAAPSRRFINLDPLYFTDAVKPIAVGILRHELGHTLGYRHEHLQEAAPGCYKEKTNEPDSNWLPLTSYDSKSVMHYFCGANQNRLLNPKLNLSSKDIAAHRELYKIPAPPGPAGFSLPPPSDSGSGSDPISEIHRAAYRDPFNEAAVKAYIATLPSSGDYFVVEGDIRMTEQELRAYLASKQVASGSVTPSGELLVNVVGGEADFYRNVSERELTYAVDRKSFPSAGQFEAVVEQVERASKSWIEACNGCGLKFRHLAEHDNAPSNDKVNFTVRYFDSQGDFVAAAFFPHDSPSRRFLDIDPSFFKPELKEASVGILRHELGHVLGYRHEHIRDIAGCRTEGGQWLPLTPYDPKSVMHYWCGGGGTPKLELSDQDKQAHKKLYDGTPVSMASASIAAYIGPLEPKGPELIIRFQGGNVAENAATTIKALTELGLLRLNKYKVEPNETIETIFKKALLFPFFSSSFQKLTARLNGDKYEASAPKPGDTLLFPDVKFNEYYYSINLQPENPSEKRRLDQLVETQHFLMMDRKEQPETGITKLTFKGYEIRIPLDSPQTVMRLRAQLKEIPSENLLILTTTPFASGAARFFVSSEGTQQPADRFMQMVIDGPPPIPNKIQGFIGSFTGLATTEEALKNCDRGTACPEIVLVDVPVELHPDIKPAIKEGGNNSLGRSEMVHDDRQFIEVGTFNETADHGTYMAGIIASQDNGYGLIGVHPGAKIVSLDWLRLRNTPDQLAKLIERRNEAPGFQIYVFANAWKWDDPLADNLTNTHVVAQKLDLVGPLWITAAGNETAGGKNIKAAFPTGPMNIGYLKNVVVVTAYTLDNQNRPHLLREANFSTEGLVHIAAPGDRIPSTVSVSKYSFGSGTSPATAFVASVASAMVSKWQYYRTPDVVKFRLQLTATPSFTGDQAKKVASGILNPTLALLDPTVAWFRNSSGEYKPVTLRNWCQSNFRLVNPASLLPVANGAEIEPDLIYRLYRVGNTDQWIVYTKIREGDEVKLGALRRIGPGALMLNGASVTSTTPFFSDSAGKIYSPNSFGDLILSQAIQTGICQPPPGA